MLVETKFNKHQIYGILKTYHWKVKEIKRIDYELSKTDFSGVQQWGIEATLPHAVGIVGKALENEIIRRSNKSERLLKYIEEINFINGKMENINDEREKVVLDCLLDGLTLTAISKHLGVGRTFVADMRDDIVDKLAK